MPLKYSEKQHIIHELSILQKFRQIDEEFSFTRKIFRQINSLITYLVKPLLSRNFCQNCMREEFRNFHTVEMKLLLSLTISSQKVREMDAFFVNLHYNVI